MIPSIACIFIIEKSMTIIKDQLWFEKRLFPIIIEYLNVLIYFKLIVVILEVKYTIKDRFRNLLIPDVILPECKKPPKKKPLVR